ncbi:MAG: histidine kinase dimerization/phospho-acceptor domain-containing protein, partial [Candidatus Enteromonas sp.]
MKQRNKYIIYGAAWALILAIGTASIFGFSHFRNQNRVLTQIDEYIHELSVRTSSHVSDVFSDKESAIASISYLYGKGLDSEDPDLEMLGRLEEDSGFDWIRFVDRDGNDYTSEEGKSADVSDRDYFISGIAGDAGVAFVPASRVNGKKLVGFYAPVYTDAVPLEQNLDPVGVMVGFIEQSTVASILETNLYEHPVETVVFDHSGAVIGRYASQNDPVESVDYFARYVSESDQEAFFSAVKNGTSTRFDCGGDLGRSSGYVIPVDGTPWTLMQIYPPSVAQASLSKSDTDGILYITLFAALAGALAAVGFVLINRMKRMAIEVESHQEKERQEAARRKDLDIIQSLSTIYSAVFYVELKGDRFETIRFDTDASAGDLGIGQGGKSAVTLEYFANEFVLPAFANDFLAFTDASTLPERLKGKHSLSMEVQADIKKDGHPTWLECAFIPAKKDEEGNITYVLFGVSIIEERKTKDLEQKESLQKALGQAQEASKAKTTFLSNMSHDIRTPMNAVLGYANLALEHIEEKEKVVDCLEKLRQAGDNLLDLLNNVLQISRIESGRSVVNARPCNFRDVNDSIVATFESSIQGKNLHFSYRSDLEHPYVHADATKIRQIITNILSNAIKYTPQNGAVG